MNNDWKKAVTQLCIIAQSNEESMGKTIRYIELMNKKYGLDADSFRKLYDDWFRSGEVREEYREMSSVMANQQHPLYYRGIDGMCRMLDEGIIDEDMFCELLWETSYEAVKEDTGYAGFYPSLPGCIGFADSREDLEKEMQTVLKKWIRQAFYMWRENKILEE